MYKGPVTKCNFSYNLQRNSTVGRCKIGIWQIHACFHYSLLNVFLTHHALQVARKILSCDKVD